ncbi:DUF4380 domain-containing protein [Massilia forsythiae]|uniref:DUF4380 domain-containing protein n=1 Tax=Massilia forsythiae TaxID=2728020 RepID=A0A7Z2ZTJ3_9BURK|nr:DUF4380 domain-containing protein [Massilia forsythiae]QJE01661.1 DUF4380 domain-containing protein [Massilia forsythiae]
MTKTSIAALLLALAPISATAGARPAPVSAPLTTHALDNGTVRASITDAIGGRLLSFALAGKANFLKIDTAAGDPGARVDADTGNVGYLGHEVWIGPQKQWWSHQDANPGRAAAGAEWPPDPYLSLARYTVVRSDRAGIALASPASPVNGLQLDKRYNLVPGRPNSLRLEVDAVNRRRAGVAWDIWFNTRVHGDTRVYVPVARREDVAQHAIERGADIVPLAWTLADGVLSIDMAVPEAGGTEAGVIARKAGRRNGKLLLQPSGGWMAGFRDGMALVIQFALQPRAAIHPDQGQVELYNDYAADDPGNGLLEMEVHAPYRQLAPGARMAAAETWTLLPYDGPDTRAAHLDFLRAQAQALGLAGIGAAR